MIDPPSTKGSCGPSHGGGSVAWQRPLRRRRRANRWTRRGTRYQPCPPCPRQGPGVCTGAISQQTRKMCHNLAMVHMGILRGTMENMRKTIEKHRVSLKYGLILGYHGPDRPTWRIHGGSGLETMDPQDPPLRSSQGGFNQSESGSSNEHSWDH